VCAFILVEVNLREGGGATCSAHGALGVRACVLLTSAHGSCTESTTCQRDVCDVTLGNGAFAEVHRESGMSLACARARPPGTQSACHLVRGAAPTKDAICRVKQFTPRLQGVIARLQAGRAWSPSYLRLRADQQRHSSIVLTQFVTPRAPCDPWISEVLRAHLAFWEVAKGGGGPRSAQCG
jgi:hypothetical protein